MSNIRDCLKISVEDSDALLKLAVWLVDQDDVYLEEILPSIEVDDDD